MEILDIVMAKGFTKKTLNGGGSIKGSPCTIESETTDKNGNTVITFLWTLSNGTKERKTITIKNGTDGKNGSNGTDGKNGKSAYEIALNNGFSGDEKQWLDSLKGKDGKDGKDGVTQTITNNGATVSGKDGKSAYEVAVKNGFSGSETEWLDSLKGEDGKDGKSAYEIAKQNGFSGSETKWLQSLKGKDGEFQNLTEEDYTKIVNEVVNKLQSAEGVSL